MKIKEYNQMMKHLTRSKPEVEKSKKREFVRTPIEAPQTQLKPLIDLEKEIAKYDDDFVETRGKQTSALINTTNKTINDQIKKGNIKKEDMILKPNENGLMTNKAKTIAIRDSFVAAQFNKALGVNEPEATPEQFGQLAEKLERNRQMQGKSTKVKEFKKGFGPSPFVKKKQQPIKSEPIKLNFDFKPLDDFKLPPRDPYLEALEKRVLENARQSEEEKRRIRTSGLAALVGVDPKKT